MQAVCHGNEGQGKLPHFIPAASGQTAFGIVLVVARLAEVGLSQGTGVMGEAGKRLPDAVREDVGQNQADRQGAAENNGLLPHQLLGRNPQGVARGHGADGPIQGLDVTSSGFQRIAIGQLNGEDSVIFTGGSSIPAIAVNCESTLATACLARSVLGGTTKSPSPSRMNTDPPPAVTTCGRVSRSSETR